MPETLQTPVPAIELFDRPKLIPSVTVMSVIFVSGPSMVNNETAWVPIAKVRRCNRLQRVALSYFLNEDHLITRALCFEFAKTFIVLHPWKLLIGKGEYDVADAIDLQRNS